MSIVVMKRKTQASLGSLSAGLPRFSLVGGHRSQGFVGQGVASRHFTLSNGGQVSLEKSSVVKSTVGNYPSPGVNSTGSSVFPCGWCTTYKGYAYGSQSDYVNGAVQLIDCGPYNSVMTLDWSNNQLSLFTAGDGLTATYALVPGQYNVVSFEQMLLGVLPTGWGLALDVPSGVFTLSNRTLLSGLVTDISAASGTNTFTCYWVLNSNSQFGNSVHLPVPEQEYTLLGLLAAMNLALANNYVGLSSCPVFSYDSSAGVVTVAVADAFSFFVKIDSSLLLALGFRSAFSNRIVASTADPTDPTSTRSIVATAPPFSPPYDALAFQSVFAVQPGSTCGSVLGFSSLPLASSSPSGVLAMPNPCGFFTPLPSPCPESCLPRQPPAFAPKPNIVRKDSFAGGTTLRQTDYADYLRKKRGLVQSSCPLAPSKTMWVTSATNLQTG